METSFLEIIYFWWIEFLSTTVNQGTIIRIENIIIVNKIDKFNVSGFRNTQAHSQRSSQCGERPNQSRAQILDFWTSISRNSLWKHTFYPKYPNRIFVNSIWLHTPRKKIGVLFLSVYWQVSHYQLFRTLKTFQNNSLSWVNRSSGPHHENVIFIQNNQF